MVTIGISSLAVMSRALLAVFLLCAVVACVPLTGHSVNATRLDFSRNPTQQARLNSFLVLEEPDAPGLRMEVSRIELLADDLWLPILNRPLIFDSAQLGDGQLFLGGQSIQPGQYHRMRMTIARAEAQNSTGDYVEITNREIQVEFDLTAPLGIKIDNSPTLFLTWDVRASLSPEGRLTATFAALPPKKQMLRELILVSCPNIDTVFVIRADNNWVVDSFGVKGAPTYMLIDPDPTVRLLYVLTSRDRMVKVIDLETQRMIDFFAVPLNDNPTYMTMSPDGRDLFLLDENNGYLTRVDARSGQNLARALLEYRPSFALYLEELNKLAVSQALSQNVLLLNPDDFMIAGRISTGSSPQGLIVNAGQLYVAESGENSVSIVDLAGRGQQSRVSVGFGPRRLLADGRQVFVSNTQNGTLSVLGDGRLGVIQEIFGFDRPLEMALNSFYRRLYVTDESAGALKVVDVNANRIVGNIELGAQPFGVVVLQ